MCSSGFKNSLCKGPAVGVRWMTRWFKGQLRGHSDFLGVGDLEGKANV